MAIVLHQETTAPAEGEQGTSCLPTEQEATGPFCLWFTAQPYVHHATYYLGWGAEVTILSVRGKEEHAINSYRQKLFEEFKEYSGVIVIDLLSTLYVLGSKVKLSELAQGAKALSPKPDN